MPTLLTDTPLWTLDIGESENRFSLDWLDQVEEMLTRITTGSDAIAVVVRGTGKFFSNGLDLEEAMANPESFLPYAHRVQEMLASVLALPVPTVAAVNGHAFGAGAMLALACDFRVMRAERGFFCLPEVDIRIPFTPGMSALVQAKLSPRAAMASMTTGKRFGGEEALAYGIVDAISTEADLLESAGAMVRGLAGKDRMTLRTIKERMFPEALTRLRETPQA